MCANDDDLNIDSWMNKYCGEYNLLYLNIYRFIYGYTRDELFVAKIISNRLC